MGIIKIITNDKFLTTVATVSAAVSAIAALCVIWQARSAWREKNRIQ